MCGITLAENRIGSRRVCLSKATISIEGRLCERRLRGDARRRETVRKKPQHLINALRMIGGVCLLGYVFTALRGVSPAAVRVGGILFYVGIALLLISLALRWRYREKAEGDSG